ncbi:hypothetical protein D3C76_1671680 [compost metagenome]
MRAKNGVAAMVNGTTAAQTPYVVPTMSRVNGISATIKIRKGTERNRFTNAPSARFSAGAS